MAYRHRNRAPHSNTALCAISRKDWRPQPAIATRSACQPSAPPCARISVQTTAPSSCRRPTTPACVRSARWRSNCSPGQRPRNVDRRRSREYEPLLSGRRLPHRCGRSASATVRFARNRMLRTAAPAPRAEREEFSRSTCSIHDARISNLGTPLPIATLAPPQYGFAGVNGVVALRPSRLNTTDAPLVAPVAKLKVCPAVSLVRCRLR